MKLPLLKMLLLLVVTLPVFVFAQNCTIDDASACVCEDGKEKCDLLPNLKVSRDLLADGGARAEFGGVLRFSVSTPNIGHGPLRIIPTNNYICGKDTIFDTPIDRCPDGSLPSQLVRQRIYVKNKNKMEYRERDAGFMAFHPDHGHMHFNSWNKYTLRLQDPKEPDPLKWPLIGEEGKIGFCLENTNSCEFYDGYCRDENDAILTTNIPNYGLGEKYTCLPDSQGISVGWMDIYFLNVSGMLITLPEGTCNGKYKLIAEVDPDNQIVEENENDNIEMVDVTLKMQTDSIAPKGDVFVSGIGQSIGCDGLGVELSVPRIGSSYLWSNGDTTHLISVTEPGLYSCVIQTPCGETKSNEVLVTADVCTTDCIDINIKALLEGPFDTTAYKMITILNTKLGLLPGQNPANSQIAPTPKGQPYRVAPWNYDGIEGYDWNANAYPVEAVDWVLVSLRKGLTKDTEFLQAAALLLDDGKIKFVSPCVLPTAESPDSMYIVVEHRNHIGIMTPNPVHLNNKRLEYDFRKNSSYQGSAGSGSGQKLLPDSITWVMFAGDGEQFDFPSFDINGFDKSAWSSDNGRSNIYRQSDYNLDGDASGFDKIFWDSNNGITSRVPK